MHTYNVNTLRFGTVSFDSFSRFLCLYCSVYYVYDNPTYEVANKLICIVYLISCAFKALILTGYCNSSICDDVLAQSK